MLPMRLCCCVPTVNSVCWAPQELGLILICGSSDGAISVISSTGDGTWDTKKISNAHTVGITHSVKVALFNGVWILPHLLLFDKGMGIWRGVSDPGDRGANPGHCYNI